MIEYKTFGLKLIKAGDEGIVEGLCSTFGNIDLQDDIVERGAFKKTLQESKGIIPILDHHNPREQIGWNLTGEETDEGLLVKGQLDLNVQRAKERFSLARKAVELGAKMGMSIGYRTIKAEPDPDRPSVRRLKEVRLLEWSFATFPANPMARLTGAKSLEDLGISIAERLYALLKTEPPKGTRVEVVAEADIDPVIQSMKLLAERIRAR